MLTSLHLKNFRGFADHELPLRELTIVVGRNNAGKSTIVEAFRIVALITSRFGNLNFRGVPSWLNVPRLYRGVSPDLSRVGLEFKTVFHHYGDPPALIRASFKSGVAIEIYIGPDEALHAVIFDAKGVPVPDKARSRNVRLPLVSILPQIGPLSDTEDILNEDYVRRTIDSQLASLHFRNQLYLDKGAYRRFRQLVEQSWPGVRIRELNTIPGTALGGGGFTSGALALLVQNDDFVAEASRMGHGLQMWLQTVWFLARTATEATVILDEPDVYMHPDLQRRLLRLVAQRHAQTIIATHSSEMISDVGPESVLIVDRGQERSQFASSLPEVQKVIDALGGVHNLHLARLSSAKRFIIVEGDDLEILGPIHQRLFPATLLPIQSIPNGEAGGWSGWERAAGAATAIRRAFGAAVDIFAIFDSDYHSAHAITNRYERAEKEQLRLHVWGRKEIENYLLVPAAICRLIATRTPGNGPAEAAVVEEIERIAQALRREVVGAMIDSLHALDKKKGPGTAYKVADAWCDAAWQTREGRWAVIGGKTVITELSKWSHANFNVTFGPVAIARTLLTSEIPEELVHVLGAIERSEMVDDQWRSDPTSRPAP